jgi:GT2 family glycosyltransferase
MTNVLINNCNRSDTPLPSVLIVIVTWNGKDDLLECLASMKQLNYPQENYKVLVVDNGSGDGTPLALATGYPEIHLIKNNKNLGYVRAVNQGVEYGLEHGFDYVWICNNDIVADGNLLKILVKTGQTDEKIGVIAPVVYSYNSPLIVENAGYKINYWIGRLKKLKYGHDIFVKESDTVSAVDSQMGCSNLIKAVVFKEVGLFRRIYELYFEETDFNARARKKGFQVVVVKDAKVWHKTASTMNKFIFRRAYLLLRNLFLFELLNAQWKHQVVFIPYCFLIHLPYFLIYGSIYGLKVKFKKD